MTFNRHSGPNYLIKGGISLDKIRTKQAIASTAKVLGLVLMVMYLLVPLMNMVTLLILALRLLSNTLELKLD